MSGHEHQQALDTNPDRLISVAMRLADSVSVTLRFWDRNLLSQQPPYQLDPFIRAPNCWFNKLMHGQTKTTLEANITIFRLGTV
jgi:hypothetical protein